MSVRSLRVRAFRAQAGRCFYCLLPMWEVDLAGFASRHGITVKQARWFRCTAEHLVARSAGGRDVETNIVAACWRCNAGRHRRRRPPEPERWQVVRRREAMTEIDWSVRHAPNRARP
jgi:5-methylcytosine-specific restriction endonuclease McrA